MWNWQRNVEAYVSMVKTGGETSKGSVMDRFFATVARTYPADNEAQKSTLWQLGANGNYAPKEMKDGIVGPVNNEGQIIGNVVTTYTQNWHFDGGTHLWQKDKRYAFSQLIPEERGWKNIIAKDLNNHGVILANATKTRDTDDNPIPEDQQKQHAVLLVPADMAVDAYRDGTIKFAGNRDEDEVADKPFDCTTETKPFRFWLNNDNDTDTGDVVPSSNADCSDQVMIGRRDLEDMTRLQLNFGAMHEQIANGQILVGFKWKNTEGTNPSINIFEHVEQDGGALYLSDESVAAQQSPGVNLRHTVKTKDNQHKRINAGETFIIHQSFWSGLSAQQPNKYLLFEGCAEGKGQLVMTFHKPDGTEIGESAGVWLELMDVKKMYQRGYADAHNPIMPYAYFDEPLGPNIQLEVDPNYQQEFKKPSQEQPFCIVFVHGYNITYADSTNYAETMFKRLWHKGYQGRFATFRWPTFGNSTIWPPNGAMGTYNDSEYRAWNSGLALKQFVSSMPQGYSVNMVAHSMGNIVVSQAIKEGMNVRHYAMLHAATSASCYSNETFAYQAVNRDPLHPSIDDDPSGSIRVLGYQYWLGSIGGNPINFRNNKDRVVGLYWNVNNSLFKPQPTSTIGFAPDGGELGYAYELGGMDPLRLHSYHSINPLNSYCVLLRRITDEKEAKAYASYSLTGAVGYNETMGGAITDFVDNSEFGNEHSSEWSRNIQDPLLNNFYNVLIDRFGL